MKQKIYIGPAGWAYKDWKGLVYPANAGAKFDPLYYLANFFNTIEINSSYYGPPSGNTSKSWVDRVAHNADFRFTAKLYKLFTHDRAKATVQDETAFRAGMDPLAQAGILGAVLVQFPWSFKNTPDERKYLEALLIKFRDYPLVLEVRHASWNQPAFYEYLQEREVGFVNIDQPLFHKSIKPSARTTAPIGYVRLHGRNYQNWFSEKAGVVERYDYLYTPQELEPWVDKVKQVARQSSETYVITNNHARGKAVVNALEIKAQIAGGKIPTPDGLVKEYPHLAEIAGDNDPELNNARS